jgi:hypothetical protein
MTALEARVHRVRQLGERTWAGCVAHREVGH